MKKWQKKALVSLVLLVPLVLGACSSNNEEANEATQGSSGGETMTENVSFTDEWDKVFPESDTVNHRKVTFQNRYGITLVADLYEPIDAQGPLPAIAVSGPFGAVKEQASGLYAQMMAERGFVTIAFDPSLQVKAVANHAMWLPQTLIQKTSKQQSIFYQSKKM